MKKKIIWMMCISLFLISCSKKQEQPVQKQLSEEDIKTAEEQGRQVGLQMLKESDKETALVMVPSEGIADVFDTKIGGTPYLPPDFDYPYDKEAGMEDHPLFMLAQFNFSQFPKNDRFPDHGILQIYISGSYGANMYGYHYENPSNDASFRVIYFEDIETDTTKLQSPPKIENDEDFPLQPMDTCIKLQIEEKAYPTIPEMEDYSDIMASTYQKLYHEDLEKNPASVYLSSAVYETLGYTPSRMSGHPYYIQGDPRSELDALVYDEVLALFQPDLSDHFMFADGGCAVFMINHEDLKKHDFSDVYYTWDCF